MPPKPDIGPGLYGSDILLREGLDQHRPDFTGSLLVKAAAILHVAKTVTAIIPDIHGRVNTVGRG